MEQQKTPCQVFLESLVGNWIGTGHVEYQITQVLQGSMSNSLQDPTPVRRTRRTLEAAAKASASNQNTFPKELSMRSYCTHPDDAAVRINGASVMKCTSETGVRWVLHRNTGGIEVVNGTVDAAGLKVTLDSDEQDGDPGHEELRRTQYMWSIEPVGRRECKTVTFLDKRSAAVARPGLNMWTLMNWTKGYM